jgi:hypothetical protein
MYTCEQADGMSRCSKCGLALGLHEPVASKKRPETVGKHTRTVWMVTCKQCNATSVLKPALALRNGRWGFHVDSYPASVQMLVATMKKLGQHASDNDLMRCVVGPKAKRP